MAKKKNALEEFVQFVKEQGVVGLAVAVILGAAAKDVVDSLVNDVINPVIGLLFDAESLSSESFTIGSGADAAVIGWGNLVSTLISFAVVAAVVYFVLNKAIAKFDKK